MKSFLVVVIVMMAITSCIPYRRIVTTPVVPEITIMEKVIVMPEPAVTVVKIKENIMFDYDSFEIKDSETVKINAIKNLLIKYPDTNIVLRGYASTEGKMDYNWILSDSRARSVADALVEKGIKAKRISLDIGGETSSFGDLLDLNRRVLILDIK
jgi:outer membrane protein OmpA-like peptidoglycan-associated protein